MSYYVHGAQFMLVYRQRRQPVQFRGVHGNGNSHSHGICKVIAMGMGVVFGLLMGMVLTGMGIAYFIGEK